MLTSRTPVTLIKDVLIGKQARFRGTFFFCTSCGIFLALQLCSTCLVTSFKSTYWLDRFLSFALATSVFEMSLSTFNHTLPLKYQSRPVKMFSLVKKAPPEGRGGSFLLYVYALSGWQLFSPPLYEDYFV